MKNQPQNVFRNESINILIEHFRLRCCNYGIFRSYLEKVF